MTNAVAVEVAIEQFPPGCRVRLPSGERGTVRRWISLESRRFPAERVLVDYDDEKKKCVSLAPRYLRRID